MLIWVCSQFRAPKYARLNIGKEEGAHLSENKGVKSECKKFGKNSRQMASVSTVCDEYCSSVVIYETLHENDKRINYHYFKSRYVERGTSFQWKVS